jgi:hypothetical protein
MKRLSLTYYFWLIVMVLVTISARPTSAQQQRFKEGRKSYSIKSGQAQRGQEPKHKEQTVRAGQLTSGETRKPTQREASTLRLVRRNPSLKVTKGERPAGRRPASPRLEFAGGHERAREPVSPREDFRAKQ